MGVHNQFIEEIAGKEKRKGGKERKGKEKRKKRKEKEKKERKGKEAGGFFLSSLEF